jgi:hypothetical protein
MSERLLEADFVFTNLRTLFQKAAEPEAAAEEATSAEDTATEEETTADETTETATEETEETSEETPKETTEATATELEVLPGKGEWDKWKELLAERIKANNALSATEKKTQYEVESNFFRDFFVENWSKEIGEKLILIGDPLIKAIKVLGFNPAKNPILGFIRQKRVVSTLITTKKLNVETFKAIYNAVANNLIAHSELINEKPKNEEYNIIYCLDLYNKPVKEMLEYIKLQSQILKVSATQYTEADQLKNKRAFLYVDAIKEQEENKRATEINKLSNDQLPIVASAKLNTLALARVIDGKVHTPTTSLGGKEQDKLVVQLVTLADKHAALLALVLTTQNVAAKNALNDTAFAGLSSDDKLKAAIALSEKGIMPKGQLNKTDADTLVAKIMASLHKEN